MFRPKVDQDESVFYIKIIFLKIRNYKYYYFNLVPGNTSPELNILNIKNKI